MGTKKVGLDQLAAMKEAVILDQRAKTGEAKAIPIHYESWPQDGDNCLREYIEVWMKANAKHFSIAAIKKFYEEAVQEAIGVYALELDDPAGRKQIDAVAWAKIGPSLHKQHGRR